MSPYHTPPATTLPLTPPIPPHQPMTTKSDLPVPLHHLNIHHTFHQTTNRRTNPAPTNPYHMHHYHSWQQLRDWLTQARQTKPTALIQQKLRSNNTTDAPSLQQQLMQPIVINEAWGNAVSTTNPSHIFWVLSKNMNTLSAADDFTDWRGAAQACADYAVTVACFQETNLQWSPPLFQRVQQIFHNLPEHQAKLATSNSIEVTPSNYPPGGTYTAVLGRWTSHAHTTAQDHYGMGRWSSIEFEGKNACQIVIVTGYRSCNQQSRLGSSTFHDQQY